MLTRGLGAFWRVDSPHVAPNASRLHVPLWLASWRSGLWTLFLLPILFGGVLGGCGILWSAAGAAASAAAAEQNGLKPFIVPPNFNGSQFMCTVGAVIVANAVSTFLPMLAGRFQKGTV